MARYIQQKDGKYECTLCLNTFTNKYSSDRHLKSATHASNVKALIGKTVENFLLTRLDDAELQTDLLDEFISLLAGKLVEDSIHHRTDIKYLVDDCAQIRHLYFDLCDVAYFDQKLSSITSLLVKKNALRRPFNFKILLIELGADMSPVQKEWKLFYSKFFALSDYEKTKFMYHTYYTEEDEPNEWEKMYERRRKIVNTPDNKDEWTADTYIKCIEVEMQRLETPDEVDMFGKKYWDSSELFRYKTYDAAEIQLQELSKYNARSETLLKIRDEQNRLQTKFGTEFIEGVKNPNYIPKQTKGESLCEVFFALTDRKKMEQYSAYCRTLNEITNYGTGWEDCFNRIHEYMTQLEKDIRKKKGLEDEKYNEVEQEKFRSAMGIPEPKAIMGGSGYKAITDGSGLDKPKPKPETRTPEEIDNDTRQERVYACSEWEEHELNKRLNEIKQRTREKDCLGLIYKVDIDKVLDEIELLRRESTYEERLKREESFKLAKQTEALLNGKSKKIESLKNAISDEMFPGWDTDQKERDAVVRKEIAKQLFTNTLNMSDFDD
jgi:hypothetical protein